MKIQKAYKVELKPNNKQRTLLEKSAGVARFAYNLALDERIKKYNEDKTTLTAIDQHKSLCARKKEEFPWMYDVSKCAPQEAIRDLDSAFKNFFRGIKKGQKIGFPKFKSKHKSKPAFTISFGFYVTNSTINIPKVGYVRLKEKDYIPVKDIHINSMTVSKTAGRWFASVQCEVEIPEPISKIETVLGVDVGIKTLATCSDGETFENPKNLRKAKKKLAHAQKNLARKKFDPETKNSSKNRESAKLKVQRIHFDIANKRKDAVHKMTSELVKTKPRYFALEDLNVSGMMKNHCLAGAVADASFAEIKRQIGYKTAWYGGEILDVDRFYPSSKLCRMCGVIKEDLSLDDRIFICECGHIEDRDLNASINIENVGLSTLSSRGIKACGESVRLYEVLDSEAVSVKQEENKNLSKLNLAKIL
jgi:putative transposase